MLFDYANHQRALLRTVDDFGYLTYDLVGYPRRLCDAEAEPALLATNVDKRRVKELPTPADTAVRRLLPEGDAWLSHTSRTLARVYAAFLIAEDPQRRLDARKAATLMHQVSLVQHILERPELRKVLIGDEVGLGKTIEAGLIIRQLIERDARVRVLYLAPARLVSNVAREFREKLDIDARVWVAGMTSDARLAHDRVVIASIHKAVFGDNYHRVVESGPWDVLVVDECHHLSDWNPYGGKPNQSFRLVSQLVKNQPPEGRLILMSGTPHQGSEARFRNILRLLSDDGKDISGAAGRVIFRTKDRVRDWRGAPLFPAREILPPVVVQLGQHNEQWYERVALLYESTGLNGVRLRAAGWAKGQALQWAASSVQAGIGFLARLGIRRLGLNLENEALSAALSVLRPYRGGAASEPLPNLFDRITKQIGSRSLLQDGQEDEEEWEEETWRPDPELLSELLLEGVALIRSGAAQARWDALCSLIDRTGDEKVVLFAQPVETVTVVADVLAKRYGVQPALIIGSQSDEERTDQVARFQAEDGPRFLVSSKAGGEGLNMQRARHLIHLDVPWNPMDMEQRIGRIHRFGSRKKIIVDTVVAAGSREVDMYRIAREKLAMVVQHLDPEQFEVLFGRVMSLVPPKELETVLGDASRPLSADSHASDEIGRLVTEGFKSWHAFDDAYRSQADAIRATSPGEATWADLGSFVVKHGGAEDGPLARFSSFECSDEEIVEVEQSVPTVMFAGQPFACGDTGGLPASADGGAVAGRLGLNLEWVQKCLRQAFCPDRSCGVAFVKLAAPLGGSQAVRDSECYLVFLRQRLHPQAGRFVEGGVELKLFAVNTEGEPSELDSSISARLIRAIGGATRVRDPQDVSLRSDLVEIERTLYSRLRQPTDGEMEAGIRFAVWPLAVVVTVP
jgi:superfamily II DNA or RNA helicase